MLFPLLNPMLTAIYHYNFTIILLTIEVYVSTLVYNKHKKCKEDEVHYVFEKPKK